VREPSASPAKRTNVVKEQAGRGRQYFGKKTGREKKLVAVADTCHPNGGEGGAMGASGEERGNPWFKVGKGGRGKDPE